jgi:preprotein translocase SecE subunit
MTITPEKNKPGQVEGTQLEPSKSEVSGGLFVSYRGDQGRHLRMAAFWTVTFFIGFGCRFMHDIMIQWPSLREPLGGVSIPVVSVNLSPAFLVTGLIFLVGVIVVQRWQQRPKVADLLIDTEAELKKVTWPKGQEVWNASIVVIISVVIIGGFLALADAFLYRLMRAVILGIT